MTSNSAILTHRFILSGALHFSMFLSNIIVLLPEGLSLKFIVMLVCS